MMNKLCTEVSWGSLNKHGEQLCGDHVETILQENLAVLVLADGLGSGVKANILSTLTAKIISTMMANGLSIEECVSAIAAALPICKVREIAYSTFTILRVSNHEEVEIIQYDNPHVILLRNGKSYDYPKTVEVIDGKTIYQSKIRIQKDDCFLMFSDGAIYAGRGPNFNFGWQREDVVRFLEALYREASSAKNLSDLLLEHCQSLYGGEPGDDTTVCALRVRERQAVNLLIGPPSDPADLGEMLTLFFGSEGKHIICGGTTSALAAAYLQKPLRANNTDGLDAGVPPTSELEGVDLVTEGVLTIHSVLEYAKDYSAENTLYAKWGRSNDGASRIAQMIFEDATDIRFLLGRAVNPAHQHIGSGIGFSVKMKMIEELAEHLKAMGKTVETRSF